MTKLADKYGTDKGHGGQGHLYTEIYELFFLPIKSTAVKIGEIGIEKGSSLQMLRDYFPQAVIYGIDIEDKSQFNSARIKTFVADQSKRDQLENFVMEAGSDFDIIIDDGGHTMDQQQISLGYLFSRIKPGGIYIIEDVHTSYYGSYYNVEKDGSNATSVMIQRYMRTGKMASKYLTPEETAYLNSNIEYCNLFFRNMNTMCCVLKKKSDAANDKPLT
ncbi:MAG: class I SAM-dependent methyltransferase [Candidatus Omnitrophota bacterium]